VDLPAGFGVVSANIVIRALELVRLTSRPEIFRNGVASVDIREENGAA